MVQRFGFTFSADDVIFLGADVGRIVAVGKRGECLVFFVHLCTFVRRLSPVEALYRLSGVLAAWPATRDCIPALLWKLAGLDLRVVSRFSGEI